MQALRFPEVLHESLKDSPLKTPLGLYLHVPFCRDRCTYCSFVTTLEDDRKDLLVHRLIEDISQWSKSFSDTTLDTIYMGGGTPSVLSSSQMQEITEALQKNYAWDFACETTVEVNPKTVDIQWLIALHRMGWNRLSIGIQSLNDDLLHALGRIHNGSEALSSITWAQQSGFTNISGDLIVGLPGQNLNEVCSQAELMIQYGLSHLSVYLLDLDKSCALKTEVNAGRLVLPDDEAVVEIYHALKETLLQQGLYQYEISNFAKPRMESRHNNRYWTRRPYLGLGPSAASHINSYRWTNTLSIDRWLLNEISFDVQFLEAMDNLMEIPLLGLRLNKGVVWDELIQQGRSMNLGPLMDAWEESMKKFITEGLVFSEGKRIQLTTKGQLLSNRVFELFV